MRSSAPDAASQSRAQLSQPPVSSRVPSRLKAQLLTLSPMTVVTVPVPSQTRDSQPSPPETMRVPSRAMAMLWMRPVASRRHSLQRVLGALPIPRITRAATS